MAEIVALDDLVPDDIVFKLRGKEYPIPGDLATKPVMRLYRMFSELNDAKSKGDEAEQVEAASARLEEGLLELFQIQSPDLKELPFGVSSLAIVTPRVLQLLGVTLISDDDDEAAKTDPPPKPAPRRRTTGSTTRQNKKRR